MKTEEKLKNKFGTDAGFRVPEGYFEQVYIKISAELPERKSVKPQPLSRWQRIKPYVYLAAMFAGIWCTLKMVTMIADQTQGVSLDNPPALVAQAMSNPEVAAVTVPAATVTQADMHDLINETDEPAPTAQETTVKTEVTTDEMLDQPDYSDIDLNQLRAELEKDSDDDSYYFWIWRNSYL